MHKIEKKYRYKIIAIALLTLSIIIVLFISVLGSFSPKTYLSLSASRKNIPNAPAFGCNSPCSDSITLGSSSTKKCSNGLICINKCFIGNANNFLCSRRESICRNPQCIDSLTCDCKTSGVTPVLTGPVPTERKDSDSNRVCSLTAHVRLYQRKPNGQIDIFRTINMDDTKWFLLNDLQYTHNPGYKPSKGMFTQGESRTQLNPLQMPIPTAEVNPNLRYDWGEAYCHKLAYDEKNYNLVQAIPGTGKIEYSTVTSDETVPDKICNFPFACNVNYTYDWIVERKISPVKIAIVSDFQAATNDSSQSDQKAVLNLIRNEGADGVIMNGDFEEWSDKDKFANLIANFTRKSDNTLMPIFATAGNHDVEYGPKPYPGEWVEIQKILEERLQSNSDVTCEWDNDTSTDDVSPDIKVKTKSFCKFKGIDIILSAPGLRKWESQTQEMIVSKRINQIQNHNTFISNQLNDSDTIWKLCVWHRTNYELQLGTQKEWLGSTSPYEEAWLPYETCREGGAIVVNGHEHLYQRTKTLVDFSTQTPDPDCSLGNSLCVGKGKTFMVSSALGGAPDRRPHIRCVDSESTPFGIKIGNMYCDNKSGNAIWGAVYGSTMKKLISPDDPLHKNRALLKNNFYEEAKPGALFITFHVNADGSFNPYKAKGYYKTIDGSPLKDSFEVTYFDDEAR